MVVRHQQDGLNSIDHCIEFNKGAQVVHYPSLLVSATTCMLFGLVQADGVSDGGGESVTLHRHELTS